MFQTRNTASVDEPNDSKDDEQVTDNSTAEADNYEQQAHLTNKSNLNETASSSLSNQLSFKTTTTNLNAQRQSKCQQQSKQTSPTNGNQHVKQCFDAHKCRKNDRSSNLDGDNQKSDIETDSSCDCSTANLKMSQKRSQRKKQTRITYIQNQQEDDDDVMYDNYVKGQQQEYYDDEEEEEDDEFCETEERNFIRHQRSISSSNDGVFPPSEESMQSIRSSNKGRFKSKNKKKRAFNSNTQLRANSADSTGAECANEGNRRYISKGQMRGKSTDFKFSY